MSEFVDTENVAYMDEYPRLFNKVQLRHMMTPRSIGALVLPFCNRDQEIDELAELMQEVPSGS